MDTVPVTDAVVKHWKEKAGDRQTVAFCSTIAHAENVAAAFNAADIPTVMVTGETAPPLGHVLQHGMPGLLVAFGAEIARHG
jgi:superfamily II DNA or RNA helicase